MSFPFGKENPPENDHTFSFTAVLTAVDGSRYYSTFLGFPRAAPASQQWTVLCLISHFPQLDALLQCIRGLYTSAQRVDANQLASMVVFLVNRVSLPVLPYTERTFALNGQPISIVLPPHRDPWTSNIALFPIFKNLKVEGVRQIVNALLCDVSILFHCDNLQALNRDIQGLCQIIYPFSWHHTIIAVLSPMMLEMLESPTPSIFGLASKVYEDQVEGGGKRFVGLIVDLGEGKVSLSPGCVLPPFPKKESDALDKRWKAAVRSADEQSYNVQASEAQRTLNFNEKIYEGMLLCYVSLLGGFSSYRHFLTQLRGVITFSSEAFATQRGGGDQERVQFYRTFVDSGAFRIFIEEEAHRRFNNPYRTYIASGHTELGQFLEAKTRKLTIDALPAESFGPETSVAGQDAKVFEAPLPWHAVPTVADQMQPHPFMRVLVSPETLKHTAELASDSKVDAETIQAALFGLMEEKKDAPSHDSLKHIVQTLNHSHTRAALANVVQNKPPALARVSLSSDHKPAPAYAASPRSNNAPVDTPVLRDASHVVEENSCLVIEAPEGLFNGVPAAVVSRSAIVLCVRPQHGEVNINSSGGFTYRPKHDFCGSDSFQVLATCKGLDSNIANITVEVIAGAHMILTPKRFEVLAYIIESMLNRCTQLSPSYALEAEVEMKSVLTLIAQSSSSESKSYSPPTLPKSASAASSVFSVPPLSLVASSAAPSNGQSANHSEDKDPDYFNCAYVMKKLSSIRTIDPAKPNSPLLMSQIFRFHPLWRDFMFWLLDAQNFVGHRLNALDGSAGPDDTVSAMIKAVHEWVQRTVVYMIDLGMARHQIAVTLTKILMLFELSPLERMELLQLIPGANSFEPN
uniref:Predicted protein n=1 Tax=Hordeum vulgare subsp. vulgare TaxID=112509 RepID=F2E0V4_HORVV|nr:predicted protein [Hordeum vulgare subsp. vulgare]